MLATYVLAKSSNILAEFLGGLRDCLRVFASQAIIYVSAHRERRQVGALVGIHGTNIGAAVG